MGLAQARLNRLPFATLAALAAAATLYVWPALAPHLVYERGAVHDGQLWRLLTGSWVHFTASHLALNAAALAAVGLILERRGCARFALLCLIGAASAGIAVHVASPELARYGGLSGVVTAAFVYLALRGIAEPSSARWLYALLAAALACKLSWELAGGRLPFALPEDGSFAAAPMSHVGGALAGSLFFLFELAARRIAAIAQPLSAQSPR